MNNADSSKAIRAVERAAQAVRKHFDAAAAAGMHSDEFWYWLGQEIEPQRKMRPRNVSLANYGKKSRASTSRRLRQIKLFPRNQEILAIFEVSAKEGEPFMSIYKRLMERYRLGQTQVRKICEGVRKALKKKSRD
jgi:hypothetical protein